MTTDHFKRATESLYQGDQDEAAQLFNDGVTEAVARAAPVAVDTDAVVRAVTQKLAADPAIEALFEKYPAIKNKRAYLMMADEYAAGFMASGDTIDVAIKKAGEKLAGEYDIGQYGRSSRAGQSSRQAGASNEGEENYPDAIAEMRDKRPGSK